MLAVAIYNRNQHRQTTFDDSPLLIGRDPEGSHNTLSVDDPHVSDNQCLVHLDRRQPGNVILTNLGRSLALSNGLRLHRGKSTSIALPFSLCIGDTYVQILNPHAADEFKKAVKTLTSIGKNLCPDQIQIEFGPESESPKKSYGLGTETLSSWFETIGILHRQVAGSQPFFDVASRAIFTPGGLDGGMILRFNSKGGWDIAASHIPYPDFGIMYCNDLLQRAVTQRQVVYHNSTDIELNQPPEQMHTAVVCPVLDDNQLPIAAVYGFRSRNHTNQRIGIRTIEAQFVRMVAHAISTGLLRMESEAEAARTRVLLEQAFSPKVAKQLKTNPDILQGQDREVTVLFADLRGFSTICERVGTRKTYRLLTDVMDRFSAIIREHDGVIIDFYGDGLSAFWNAPFDQPDHAELGCQAALKIADAMPELNTIWMSQLGEELRVGIGVHTGIAQVGNSGSSSRLKYGPQGNTVNIAARLESATKTYGASILISSETAKQSKVSQRRLGFTKLKGIETPIQLHEVLNWNQPTLGTTQLREFEEAVRFYQAGQFNDAISLLIKIQIDHPLDQVTEYFLQQAVDRTKPNSLPGDSITPGTLVPLTNADLKKIGSSHRIQSEVRTEIPTATSPILPATAMRESSLQNQAPTQPVAEHGTREKLSRAAKIEFRSDQH